MTTQSSPAPCPQCGAPIPPEAPGGQCPKCLLGAVAAPTETGTIAPAPAGWPTLEEVRAAFPELTVESEIGRGGMAVVYKARQLHLDRPVALKILAPWLAVDADFSERFSREAKTLARLNHPCIVTIHDFGQSAGFYWLLMEYVDGVNLRQAMQAGRFTPQQALGIVPKVCEALAYAHSHGVLHRDIKPDNILLDSRGHVKLADFGIAKLAGAPESTHTLTMTGMHLGTPAYMAPEQVEKPADVDHRADIYSLGVVFYEMLTGELPLGRFAPPSEKATVDARIDEIVLRTLEKERERRYQTAEEMKTRVQSVGDGPPPPPPPPAFAAPAAPSAETVAPKAMPGAAFTALSFVFVAVALLVGAIAFSPGRGGPGGSHMPVAALGVLILGLPGLVALGCAIAGIFMGSTALGHVRRSGGRMAGAGFATFAALAWPVVLIAIMGAGIGAAIGEGLFERRFAPTPGGWLMALTFVGFTAAAVWLDVVLVRKTLRWARGDGSLTASSPPATGATMVSTPVNAVAPSEVKTSGLAIAGGVITLLSLFLSGATAVLMVWVTSRSVMPPGVVQGPSMGVGAPELLVGTCSGVLFPLLGTILGLFGMSAIRNSAGRLTGAGWAVFGGMTWPALVAGGLAYSLVVFLGTILVRAIRLVSFNAIMIFVALVGAVAAVFTIVVIFRAALRWTRASSGAATGKPAGWLIAAAVALILLAPVGLLALGLLVPAFTVRSVERRPAPQHGFDNNVRPPGPRLFGSPSDGSVTITECGGTSELRNGLPQVHRSLSLNYTATLPPQHELFLEIRRDRPDRPEAAVETIAASALRVGEHDGKPSVTLARAFAWEFPPEATEDSLEEARRRINHDWLHRSVALSEGKPEPVFSAKLSDGSTLTAAFVLRPLPPSR